MIDSGSSGKRRGANENVNNTNGTDKSPRQMISFTPVLSKQRHEAVNDFSITKAAGREHSRRVGAFMASDDHRGCDEEETPREHPRQSSHD